MEFLYSDFSLSFKKHPSTFDVLMKYDVDAVKQALVTLLLTNKGEKLFDPNFGVGIHGLLFELMTPIHKTILLKEIKNQVAIYEPRVVIDDLIINENFDTNELIVDFYFHVIDVNQTEKLSLSFKRIR